MSNIIIARVAVVLALCVATSTAAWAGAGAPASAPVAAADPVREKNELRLVEILHIMQKKPPPSPEVKKQIGDEYMSLLAYFGGFDLNAPPPKDPAVGKAMQDKALAAQGEILGRRDPALRDQLAHDLKVYACKTKQIDGKSTLRGIFVGEKSLMAETDKYSSDLKQVGANATSTRYDFVVKDVKAGTHFLARATGKGDMAGDVWEMDQTGDIKNVTDLCATIK